MTAPARPTDPFLRGPRAGEPRVALTFDDGPGDVTPALLDLFAEHGARGRRSSCSASRSPGARRRVRRAVREGHELGNHTLEPHRRVAARGRRGRGRAAPHPAAAARARGVDAAWARPPYGRDWARFARIAAGLGLRTALWSIDPRDWAEPPAEAIVERVLRELHPGAVVDLHDGWHSRSERTTVAADARRPRLPPPGARGARLPVRHAVGAGCARSAGVSCSVSRRRKRSASWPTYRCASFSPCE